MKVWVLLIDNNGCYGSRPRVYSSKEKAMEAMIKDYNTEINESHEEYGGIERVRLNKAEGWAYIDYRDGHTYFDIFEEEVQ
jgi:hypothetical protein